MSSSNEERVWQLAKRVTKTFERETDPEIAESSLAFVIAIVCDMHATHVGGDQFGYASHVYETAIRNLETITGRASKGGVLAH